MLTNIGIFEPSSGYNLAREESKEEWVSDIYDLNSYGFCHSFNPRGKHRLEFEFCLGFFLGHQSMSMLTNSKLKSFVVILHEKDQFWPRMNWNNQKQVVIFPNKSVVVSSIKKMKNKT